MYTLEELKTLCLTRHTLIKLHSNINIFFKVLSLSYIYLMIQVDHNKNRNKYVNRDKLYCSILRVPEVCV